MSLYAVTSSPLAAVPNVHEGTGTHQSSNWLVVPSSVPGSGKLQFVGNWVQVTTMLFQINANVVPNWFGVPIPNGIQDFTKANIFFHPMPAQAGYKDSDYPSKAGMWPQLFYYMEPLGYQLDGAARNQIIIMPFLTNAATDTGIFLANWSDLVTDILAGVRLAMGADDGSTLQISQVVVSSFSIGIVYSAYFRAHAPNLSPFMAEAWDFDGLFSSSPQLSKQLVSTAQYTAIKYDQNPAAGPSSFHLPLPRWSNYVAAPQSASDVHGLIRDFMFLHAASISNVGATISGGTGPTPSLGSPTAPPSPPPSGTTGTTGSSGEPGLPRLPPIPPQIPPMAPGGYPVPSWPGKPSLIPQQIPPGFLYPAAPSHLPCRGRRNLPRRLVDLLAVPRDIPFLSVLIQREIIYRLLCGPEGARLRAIATSGDQSHRTARAISWIRDNYAKPVRVDDLAQIAGMGVSTLHHHFRVLTHMSPLQYQKQLRLQAARGRMLVDGLDASTVAFEVGYESVSQFNREYKRFFGQPPMRDVRTLRSPSAEAIELAS